MSAPKPAIPGLTKLLFAIFLFCASAVGVTALLWYDALTEPGPLIQYRQVIVPKGADLQLIGTTLEKKGVIRSKWIFISAARLQEAHRELRAGEYRFRPGISIRHVIALLRKGQLVNRRFTVAEGLTIPEVLKVLESAEGLEGMIFPTPEEGTLLPDTYYYAFGETRQAMIAQMGLQMRLSLDELWPKRAPDLPIKTKREAVILASIVEKETGLEAERRQVAAVFINRLNRGMRLESDPTVRYAVTGGKSKLGRGLRRSELRRDHPYNTYRIRGLPPGPICNPGPASIAAVLNPGKTTALFFVADGNGGHLFSDTLEQHQKAVRKWRKIERARERKRQQQRISPERKPADRNDRPATSG